MHSDELIYPYLTFVHQCNAAVHSPLERYIERVFLCTCSTYAKYIFIYIYCRNVTFAPHIILYFVYCIFVQYLNVCIMSYCRRLPFNVALQGIRQWNVILSGCFCVHVPHMLNIFSYIYILQLGFSVPTDI